MAVHGTARRHHAVKRENSERIRGTQQLAQLQDIALRVEGIAHHETGPCPLLWQQAAAEIRRLRFRPGKAGDGEEQLDGSLFPQFWRAVDNDLLGIGLWNGVDQQLDIAVFQHHQLLILIADHHLQQCTVKLGQQARILGIDQGTGTSGAWQGALLNSERLGGQISTFSQLRAPFDPF